MENKTNKKVHKGVVRMNTIVIGAGEIGTSLCNVLKKQYQVTLVDKNPLIKGRFEVMHVCFPFSETFIEDVKQYQVKFNPKFTVIHSTVPVGTSRACYAWHSPVVGIHPNIEKSLITFTKFLGGENNAELINYFRRADVKVYPVDKPETTELMKVLCTSYYGLCVEYTKEVKELCKKYNVPFEVWTLWNNNYNEGYTKIGQEQFVRPNLIPVQGKIGGHCILPNLEFLESRFALLLKGLNK